MRELNIGSLGGLLYELYDLSPSKKYVHTLLQDSPGKPAFLDLNGCFWTQLLDPVNLKELLKQLRETVQAADDIPVSFYAAAAAPEMFLQQIMDAYQGLFEQDQSEQSFFEHLETLSVLCSIYSYLRGGGFRLTIQEGYLLDASSSVQLIRDCLLESKNPYLPFLRKYAWDAIRDFAPDCVWINGRLTLANMAVIRYIRHHFPHAHIFWAGEGSEYYASNKIVDYLRFNTPLFEWIDGIVLFDYSETRKELARCLEQGGDPGKVKNLLYAVRDGENAVIRHSGWTRYRAATKPDVTLRTGSQTTELRISPVMLANIHLFPDKTCFWRHCSFCGINGKYPATLCPTAKEELWPVADALQCLQNLEETGIRYFWSIDEAIPVPTLCALADGLDSRNTKLLWQARTRISPKLIESGVPECLARGGLRELRMGLESASARILAMMNKFEPEFSLSLLEDIVAAYERVGIAIHCPMIIGFPTETKAERIESYAFLRYLRETYQNFSFNINIFAMDVSSPIFSDWDSYGVSCIRFPCNPRFFLGNLVQWECAEEPFIQHELERERDQVMRSLLYPWMPDDAVVSPHILYRLLETTRSTLFRQLRKPERTSVDKEKNKPCGERFVFSPYVVKVDIPASATGQSAQYLYSLQTHGCIAWSRELKDFSAYASVPRTREELCSFLLGLRRVTGSTAAQMFSLFLDTGILTAVCRP